ncbi:SLC13 family permease [Bacillus subtilis]|nr:SLC13 family permease [Bacillus subtilis]
MSIHIIGIVALALVFVLGTLRPVNIGIIALIATFLLGSTFGGESPEGMLAEFPADIFVLLVGVTYLFGLASTNGTLEWVVEKAVHTFGDRPALVPWLIFVFSAIPTTAGALGPAGIAMLAPLCLRLGKRYGLSPYMSALMVMHGSCAGNFSPLNGLAIIAQTAAEKNGLEVSSLALFLGNLGYNLAIGVVIYFSFGGIRLLNEARTTRHGSVRRELVSTTGGAAPAPISGRGPAPLDYKELDEKSKIPIRLDQVVTLVVIVAVAIAALVFDVDLGFMSLLAAGFLHCIFANRFKGADKKIVWSVVVLICGVTTLVGLLERYGTIAWVGDGIVGIGAPLLTAFVLCLVGAATSAFGSSTGLIGVLVPLAVPFIANGDISATWVLVALAISATVVDTMPFSSLGALTLSTTPESERPKLFRFMLAWGGAMIVTAPIFTWMAFILPTSL